MSDDKFEQAKCIISRQVKELSDVAFREKLTLHYIQGNREGEISYPSISIHSDDVDSKEVTETFSEMLLFRDSNIDDLTDAQTHELKRLRASDNALK